MSLRSVRRASLVGRLVLLATGWSLAVLLLAGFALTLFFQRTSEVRFDRGLREQLDNLYAGVSINAQGAVTPPDVTDVRTTRGFSGRYWLIAEPQGGQMVELARSQSMADADTLAPPPGGVAALAAMPGQPVFYRADGPDRQALRVAAMQVRLPRRTTPVIFLAAEDRRPLRQDERRFAVVTGATLLLLGLGLILAVLIQVRVGLAPLFDLRREVATVRTGRGERLVKQYPSELEPLAHELNALLAHNQEVIERQRTHVGNLAHALKTPLSVMLTEAAQQPGRLAEIVARQAETMRAQVDHHLRRARAAARSQSRGERTPVSPVLDELSRTLERIFQSRGVSVEWSAPEELAFQGERQDLLELVGNVMENACKWCRRQVSVEAEGVAPHRLRVTVEDDGPGLPADQREAVFRRGERLDENAPGSGLGLSIVDELARAYGGSISLGEAALGGLKVVLELPRTEA